LKHGLAILLTLLLLGGCASVPRSTATAQASWNGRLAVVIDSTPKQSHQATFALYGDAKAGELNLLSPFGATVAQARWQQNSAILTQGRDQQVFANLADLSDSLLDAALPIEALFDWLNGKPTVAAGWRADLCQLNQGRLLAQRTHPAPAARLTLIFDADPSRQAPPCEPLN